MDNMKRYIALCLILLTFSLLFCGCKDTSQIIPDTESENVLGSQTESKDNLGPQTGNPDAYPNGEFILPTLKERTAWNIELKLLKIDDKGIWITIYDYDNQGFEYNTLYYVLERYENGEWIKLTKMNESNAYRDLCEVIPSKNASFIDTNDLNFFSLLPSDVDFCAGHYRLTKVLSGREFSVEFDYEP